MTPAQQRHTERLVKAWAKRLKLDHWRINIPWDQQPEDPDAMASVEVSDLYEDATIRFRADFGSHDIYEKNRIVVHELMHIVVARYGLAVRSIAITGNVSGDARALWYDRCHDEEEALVDRMAHRFVELAGVVK